MIIDGELSLSQQTKGRKKLLLFSFFNGIALTCVTGNVLSLYLLKLGCTSATVAVIASFTYLAALFVFLGRSSIAKIGATGTLKYSWFLCCLTAILLSFIPFSYPHYSRPVGLLIMGAAFLFFISKSIGTASLQPLMGEFTSPENQGKFSSKFFLVYNIATVITIVGILYLILSVPSSKILSMFQIIIFLGAIFTFIASCIFIKMKETKIPSESAHIAATKEQFFLIWKERKYRYFLYVRSFGRASLILIVPISILALKQTYGVSDHIALIFAFIQLAGGIIITYLNGVICEETGPKPLIIIYLLFLFFISLLWIFAPATFHWGYCVIIFFMGGVSLCGLDSCLIHYYLAIVPKENRVGISLWYTAMGGAVAGILGLVLGGGLIKLLSLFTPHADLFRFYYAIIFFIMIPMFYFASNLTSVSKWSVKNVLGLVTSPYELYTMYQLNRLRKYSTPTEELASVIKLDEIKSNLTEDSLLYYLASPKYFVRLTALRAISHIRLGHRGKAAVYNELKRGEFSSAFLAAIILARNQMPEAIPLLRKYLDSKDIHLKANCMITLATMEDRESYSKIIRIFQITRNLRLILNGAMALSIINDINTLSALLQKSAEFANTGKDYITDEITCAIAKITGCEELFYKSQRIFENYTITGILNIIESMNPKHVADAPSSPQEILHSFFSEKIKKVDMIRFLLHTLDKRVEKAPEHIVFNNFLKKTETQRISSKLLVCIFIDLFCRK